MEAVKNPLNIDERRKLKEALDQNLSYSQIAIYVGRNKSTVLRESKRLGDVEKYDPEIAQEHFEWRLKEKNRKMSATKRAKKN